ncbi:hypothetical protein G6F70_003074 [Rhizopus microsporus]|nr:hypothetical protein G6F71_003047 [Rhizopus microsporus]KAG1201532.1 hypothetical protein G6F70_003074 [Rhizopus microsporus]KAG1213591.1 hypothetical protein G6F69_002691 [Rhizopus microsporus]KAG1238064.1 hypothetical protein G6F67_000718 [Rhizopus microsporus]KAG1269355.1 hypothetical protein G6F68_000348 [Rhizopus microsporus]
MTETVSFSLSRFRFHLDLYNKIKSEQIDYGSGTQKLRLQLQRAKKANSQRISSVENAASRKSIKKGESVARLEEWYQQTVSHREQLRNFYYSPTRVRQKRTYELQRRRYIDKLCSNEHRYVKGSDKSQHIMFVGDRGYCVGSTIKGHLKYGGQWKPRKNSLYTLVCITNEHNTSQACLFCFKKPQSPLRITGNTKLKVVNGSFQSVNPDCPSVLAGKATHARDSLSAMAIGLSGIATLLFGATFPQFDPKRSPSKTAEFEHLAATL